jgi:hypothetical protein
VDEGFNEAAGLRVVRRCVVMATHCLEDFRELLGRGTLVGRHSTPLRCGLYAASPLALCLGFP